MRISSPCVSWRATCTPSSPSPGAVTSTAPFVWLVGMLDDTVISHYTNHTHTVSNTPFVLAPTYVIITVRWVMVGSVRARRGEESPGGLGAGRGRWPSTDPITYIVFGNHITNTPSNVL